MAIYVNDVLVAGNGENGAPATINGVNALNIEATGGLSGRQIGDTYTIDGSGLVPKTTTVNGKPLSEDIALNAADVGARAASWMPTAAEVGADVAGAAEEALNSAKLYTNESAGRESRTTLKANSWMGSSAPWTITLSNSDITTTTYQDILPDITITAEQLEAMQSANIQDGGQTAGNVTLKAYGDKPTIDIPVRLIVRGH